MRARRRGLLQDPQAHKGHTRGLLVPLVARGGRARACARSGPRAQQRGSAPDPIPPHTLRLTCLAPAPNPTTAAAAAAMAKAEKKEVKPKAEKKEKAEKVGAPREAVAHAQ